MSARAAWLAAAAFVALAATVSAQGGGKPATGNPTPGTAQPKPPSVADRITLVGCVQAVVHRAEASVAAKAPADTSASADANTPTDSRFELTKVETTASSKSYRLEGIDSQFSPFVGAKVEITGAVKTPASAGSPTLVVEFVQRLAAKCS